MLFMIIENFKNRDAVAVYRRFFEEGRQMPDGLNFIDSWVETNLARCFQLVQCDDAALIQQWIIHWQDLVEFEVIPVVSSAQTREIIKPLL